MYYILYFQLLTVLDKNMYGLSKQETPILASAMCAAKSDMGSEILLNLQNRRAHVGLHF